MLGNRHLQGAIRSIRCTTNKKPWRTEDVERRAGNAHAGRSFNTRFHTGPCAGTRHRPDNAPGSCPLQARHAREYPRPALGHRLPADAKPGRDHLLPRSPYEFWIERRATTCIWSWCTDGRFTLPGLASHDQRNKPIDHVRWWRCSIDFDTLPDLTVSKLSNVRPCT